MGINRGNGWSQALGGKYLTFALGNEEYGIGIIKIKEIIGMVPITPVPRTPEFVKGVINLRGTVVPIIDLRLKFGIEAREYDDRTCIILVDVQESSETFKMGTVVDKVLEVVHISADHIDDTPAFGVKLDTEYILGMAKMNGKIKILLDIDKVLNSQEIADLNKVA